MKNLNDLKNTKIDYKEIWFNKKFILKLTIFLLFLGSLLLIIGMCVPVDGQTIANFCKLNNISIFQLNKLSEFLSLNADNLLNTALAGFSFFIIAIVSLLWLTYLQTSKNLNKGK